MASFRIRQHDHSPVLGVVSSKDELRQVDKSTAIAYQYDPACRTIQLADIFDQPTATKWAMRLSVSPPRSHIRSPQMLLVAYLPWSASRPIIP